jgi:small subunit ribosomal protein S20
MKTSSEQRQRNRALRSQMRGIIKDFKGLTDKNEAQKRLVDVYSVIDKAFKGGIIHRNKAARDKSRMSAFVQNLSS